MQFGSRIWIIVPFTQGKGTDISYCVGYCYITCRRVLPLYLVAEHYAIVIPVLNTKSNISCMIQNRGYFGYLRWKGGVSDLAYLEEVPRHAHFKLGDYVVTSGYSAVFPPGVRVGRILHVFNSADGLSYRVQLRLSTDFARLRDVCVIDDAAMKERLEIMRAAQDSIETNGDNNQ